MELQNNTSNGHPEIAQKHNHEARDKWNELYQKTNRLSNPSSVKCLLSKNQISNLENRLIVVLNSFLNQRKLHSGIKIYVDKKLRNDFVHNMVECRPVNSESLEEWANKIFGNRKFGIVFNSLESYDNTLSEMMSEVTSPLIERAGLPLGGLSFLFFMGNYGFTPFGIHKEAKGEEGFLFHFGPGKKEFYTWDIRELNNIEHHTKVFHNEIEDMLPSSEKYTLEPGSAMFIPNDVYHIANTETFSISLVMDYINPTRDYLENKLAKAIGNFDHSEMAKKIYLDPVIVRNQENSLLELLDSEAIMFKFRKELQKMMLLLRSNGGILNPSIITQKSLQNSIYGIKGKKVFPIFLLEDNNKELVLILARGHQITKLINSNLDSIISELNKGSLVIFEQMKKKLIPEWDSIELWSFISDLVRIEAIEILDIE